MSGRPNPINIRKGSKANRVPANSKAVAYKRAKAYVMKYEAENTASAKTIQKAIRAKKAKKEGKKIIEKKKSNLFKEGDITGQGTKVINIKNRKDGLKENQRYRNYNPAKHNPTVMGKNAPTKIYQLPSGTLLRKVLVINKKLKVKD